MEVGVPKIELVKLARRRGLTHVGYGVYRFDQYPVGGDDSYMQATLLVGHDAFLVDESVLAMHELALVNPRRIRVGSPRQVRRTTLPPTIEVVRRRVDPDDLTIYEGIPSTTVARALLDCRGRVMPERLRDGLRDARDRGLVSRREVEMVKRGLTPHPMVRPALPGDLDRIAEVEVAAGARFADIGLAEIADDPVDTDEIGRAVADGRVWVVERRGRIEGWVMAAVVDGEAHLAQVSVAPEAAGLGLGRLLAERVHRWAADRGDASITLTTFVDVAFNGPLYERWGYRTLDADELGPELAAIRADEDRRWPHLAGRRRTMRLDL
jgi:GNAT superfamily N-acetyltransferase